MSLDFTPQTVASGHQSTDAIEENFENIQTALADGLSRTGSTPNTMETDLDMNSNDILNAAAVAVQSLAIAGTQVTVSELAETELPSQSGNAGKYLKTNGTLTSWASPDSSEIAFDPGSDVDHVNTTAQAKLRQFVTPQDFGAVGDNSTDDATAIQNAIDYCDANGYTLWIPAATYRVGSNLTVLHSDIIGFGATFKCDSGVTAGLTVGSDSQIFYGRISGLAISGQGQGVHSSVSYAYLIKNASQAYFDNIEANRFPRNLGVVPEDGTRIAYCTFIQPYCHRGDYNMWIRCATATGYAAENVVIGGRFQMASGDEATNQIYAERTTGSGSTNHWKFYGPSLESFVGAVKADYGIRFRNMDMCLIEQPRTEGDWLSGDVLFDSNCSDNRLVTNYQDGSFTIVDSGTNNIVQYHERVMCETGLPMYVLRDFNSATEVTPATADVAIFHRPGAANIKVVSGVGNSSAIRLGDESDQNQAALVLGSGPAGVLQIEGTNIAQYTGSAFEPYTDSTYTLGTASRRWSDVHADQVSIGTASISSGTGTPEGVVTGTVGDMFIRTDGGAGTTLYIKESGSGNTGWAGV